MVGWLAAWRHLLFWRLSRRDWLGGVSAVQMVSVVGRLGIQLVRPTAPASVMVAAKPSDQVAAKASEQNHYPSVLERLARLEGMEPGGQT